MALIKKRDVKGYFAARRLQAAQIHIVSPSQPDATGVPAEPALAQAKFKQDFITDHSSSKPSLAPSADSSSSPSPRTPAKSKSVRP